MDIADMLFQDWTSLIRVVLVGSLAYPALVLFLRVSGKRTLAKLNAFDLVVTVALGSTLATVLLNRDVTLAEGLVALLLLIGLQFLVAWLSVRSARFSDLVKSEPTLLLHQGRLLESAMRGQRVTQAEMLAALRSGGLSGPEAAESVVLETDGTMSVMPARREG
ncbi:DUF421 domain-containing protein [Falsiroseomonas sp.]|uniref:DUF421 domain-containing protein n=1 Tax=Falsiroseomonas sp. TaxID=2870721 RepID=UPI002734108B|nr:YetF domain-containing protein [Falsiroseomonas sp.]MDP3418605.1 DUF421 domain-containing protein [Falsiroseomonas sp.]